VIPVQPDGHPYPTLALFEPQALEVLERAVVTHGPEAARIAELFDHPRTLLVPHPTPGLINANTPLEFRQASELASDHGSLLCDYPDRIHGQGTVVLPHAEGEITNG